MRRTILAPRCASALTTSEPTPEVPPYHRGINPGTKNMSYSYGDYDYFAMHISLCSTSRSPKVELQEPDYSYARQKFEDGEDVGTLEEITP